jgi:hypothetical protein
VIQLGTLACAVLVAAGSAGAGGLRPEPTPAAAKGKPKRKGAVTFAKTAGDSSNSSDAALGLRAVPLTVRERAAGALRKAWIVTQALKDGAWKGILALVPPRQGNRA